MKLNYVRSLVRSTHCIICIISYQQLIAKTFEEIVYNVIHEFQSMRCMCNRLNTVLECT